MKKILFIALIGLCFSGCVTSLSSSSCSPQKQMDYTKEIADLQETISNLTVRVTQLERRRTLLTATATNKKASQDRRFKSKLVITPEASESMNLLGERFPKHAIRLNELPKFSSSKKKPYVANAKIAPYVPADTNSVSTTEVLK